MGTGLVRFGCSKRSRAISMTMGSDFCPSWPTATLRTRLAGCIAQAWSVAETLRTWHALQENDI